MKSFYKLPGILFLIIYILTLSAGYAAENFPADKENERIAFIQQEFDDSFLHGAIWWYGWMGVYSGTAALSFGIGLTSDDDTVKITQIISGVQSVIGLAGRALSPMPTEYAGDYLRSIPIPLLMKNRKLNEGERLLKNTAECRSSEAHG
jgi:hypothetical protein